MKLVHKDSRFTIPRIESLHLYSRIVILAAVYGYVLIGDIHPENSIGLYALLGIYTAFTICAWFCRNKKFKDSDLMYILTKGFDAVFITALTRYTGGMASEFYIFYFFTIPLGALVMSTRLTLLLSAGLTVAYVLTNLPTLTAVTPITIVLRMGIIWLFALTVNYVAEHVRRSEERLLKVFNTLNRRTSELEKTHSQLEMVYENSRILAGILDFDEIVNEILKIGEKVLDYPALGIILVGPGDNLIYRGRLVGGYKNTKLKTVGRDAMLLAYNVAQKGESTRILDIDGHDDYLPLLKSAQSVMLVPMITHSKTTGLLTAESPRENAFSEQDEAFLSVLARSAAMALENAVLHRKTEELTIIDDLTGVYNFRYFSDKIGEEKRRAARYGQALSLIMLDIDWFKRFNDNYGHEVGNQVLARLVNVIHYCIRDVDILCRYGGEEFIIILPQTPENEALRIAQRIRAEVEKAEFSGGSGIPTLKVTVSVGVSTFPENGLTEGELINAVDQAMYRAKGSGKNTVCTV
ncbi:MAG: sensor domain-containing diguanylate cyclase [candidate division Zixibacteria bacterium]|nr:sensor domain-containing diguanylate cyclase [candidate division Zixibacteria bacterium]